MDKEVEENDQYQAVLNLCHKQNTFGTNLRTEQKNICEKLLRNFFLCHSQDRNKYMNCCSNLYVWLYFKIMKYGISNDIIQKIFKLPMSNENEGTRYNSCQYVTFNDGTDNPDNLMKLSIFNDNASTFYSMLKDSKDPNYCYLKKYVYECIGIYKEMIRKYPFSGLCDSNQHKYACEITNAFQIFYAQHILNKPGIDHDFPELSSDIPLKYMDECPVEDTESHTVSAETKQAPPTTRGASTALTAMVGIPPFLALIYKVNIIRT
ncbi:hypothetical protein PVIIG_06028 [Plasmodium vivax India VII]|uniref:Uncharacterized protein n=2 Tax=Plasmodium vivax TaxID=5855 RepID=A0A0J9S3Q2_PLAVI|nr:hypothetical protein PVIIG_06028 [Plasmodium vivax India VII]KMZ83171.1 hypothetical protein PVBG_05776 [Plasmodium vivax Brazil I]